MKYPSLGIETPLTAHTINEKGALALPKGVSPLREAKQRYYESLERQATAERVLDRHFGASNFPAAKETAAAETPYDFRSTDALYQELGIKTFSALSNCLDWLIQLGSRDSSSRPKYKVNHADNKEETAAVLERFDSLYERLDRLEARLGAIEAGIKRIDRFTLEAFRDLDNVKQMAGPLVSNRGNRIPLTYEPDRGRLAKEEAAKLALEAGVRMRRQGKRLTLAAVAREAGLKYGQIVYAFGNKDAFFEQLEQELQSNLGAQSDTSIDEEAV